MKPSLFKLAYVLNTWDKHVTKSTYYSKLEKITSNALGYTDYLYLAEIKYNKDIPSIRKQLVDNKLPPSILDLIYNYDNVK